MGSLVYVLSACALLATLQSAIAGPDPRCPPPEKVYTLTPPCRDSYDCGGRVCCVNQARALSCAEPAPRHAQLGNKDTTTDKYNGYGKYKRRQRRANIKQGGPGTYCAGVKCSPFEKCVRDHNYRLVCRRS